MGFFSGLSAIRRANRKLKEIENRIQRLTHKLECNLNSAPFWLRCELNQLKNDMEEFGNITTELGMSMGTYYIFMGNNFDNPLQIAVAFNYIKKYWRKRFLGEEDNLCG